MKPFSPTAPPVIFPFVLITVSSSLFHPVLWMTFLYVRGLSPQLYCTILEGRKQASHGIFNAPLSQTGLLRNGAEIRVAGFIEEKGNEGGKRRQRKEQS